MKKTKTTKKSKSEAAMIDEIFKGLRAYNKTETKVPGTVTVYQAMDKLSNRINPDDDRKEYKIAANSAAKTSKMLGSGIGELGISSVREKPIMGRDPDRPDIITNCGNVFEAIACSSFGDTWLNIAGMIDFIHNLQIGCGRDAFLTDYESKGIGAPLTFKVIFRIGTPGKEANTAKTAKKKNTAKKKSKK